MEVGSFVVIGVIVIVLLSVVLLVAAVILQVACYFVQVRAPELFPAMGLVLFVTVVDGIVHFVGNAVLTVTLASEQGAEPTSPLLLNGVGVGLSMLVTASLYSLLIPDVSFVKGIVIYWIQGILNVIVVVLAVIAFMSLVHAR